MSAFLDCWGEIAQELDVSVRTAIRYYKRHGLPIVYNAAGHPVTTKELLTAWQTNNVPTDQQEVSNGRNDGNTGSTGS